MKYSMIIIFIILNLIVAVFEYFQSGSILISSLGAKNVTITDCRYTQTEMDSLSEYISGDWLNSTYLDVLKKTKSPMKATQAVKHGIFVSFYKTQTIENSLSMHCDDFTMSDESLIIELEKGNSLTFPPVRISKEKEQTIYVSFDPSFAPESEFIKVPKLNEFIKKIVIAGSYTDEFASQTKQVVFNVNGTVTGFGKFKHYYIETDPSISNFDTICFRRKNKSKVYIFERLDNYLDIYDTYINSGSPMLQKGQLMIKLKYVVPELKK